MRKSAIAIAAAASVAATLLAAPIAGAADDYFLKIDGITGEQTTGNTPGVIEVNDFSLGAENATTIGSMSGGAGAGKLQFHTLTITKPVDSTTPAFLQKMGQGVNLGGMELVARKAAGGAAGSPIYMRYSFQPVFITKDEQTSGDEGVQETVTFTFGALQESYAKQNPNGTMAAPVVNSWNQMTNATSMLIPNSPSAGSATVNPRIVN